MRAEVARQRRVREQLLHRNVQRLQGGLVLKAHRLCVSLNSRLECNKKRREVRDRQWRGRRKECSGRRTARAEDAQGTPTQSHISPSIRVYEDSGGFGTCVEEDAVRVVDHFREKSAHARQPRPDSGLSSSHFQYKSLQHVLSCSLFGTCSGADVEEDAVRVVFFFFFITLKPRVE